MPNSVSIFDRASPWRFFYSTLLSLLPYECKWGSKQSHALHTEPVWPEFEN
jgi:hypothetical protein